MNNPISAASAEETACVVLMFKSPRRSKRRLTAEIGPLAEDAAKHMLDCALEDLDGWPGPVCYAPAENEDLPALGERCRPAAAVVVQRGDNLGERINYVNETLRSGGHARQIFIGLDCPQLTVEYLNAAETALRDHDIVLGPAGDGGVVLMAVDGAWPPLQALPWSSDRLLNALERICCNDGLSVHRLSALTDVDTLEDLVAIRETLALDRRPARRDLSRWMTRNLAAVS